MLKRLLHLWKKVRGKHEQLARELGVVMGKDNFIATTFWGSEPYLITIGSHCAITEGVRFNTHGGARVLWPLDPKFDFFGKIRIGDWVYIGSGAQIMPGVTLGDRVLVAAGSIVTKSFPAGVIIGGNPARQIGTVEDFAVKMAPYNLRSRGMSPKAKKEFLLSQDEALFVHK